MHYVRLPGWPKVMANIADVIHVQLCFEIRNDLGDELLRPADPVELIVWAHTTSSPCKMVRCILPERIMLHRETHQQVWKPTFPLPREIDGAIKSGDSVSLTIGPANPALSAGSAYNVLMSSIKDKGEGNNGLISPVSVGLSGPDLDENASRRRIVLSGPDECLQELFIGEEIGNSIACHIWDAGLVSLCVIAGTFKFPQLETSQSSCMRKVSKILNQEDRVNILELGCGVGILGIGLCKVYPRGVAECTILMTDCTSAARRARSNMGILHHQRSGSNLGYAQVMYENLDWENGRHGRFGPRLQTRRWDLIMLSDCTYNVDSIPALVGTLSEVHRLNKDFYPEDKTFSTKVFLATKPRHDDERALFDRMAAEDWSMSDKEVLSLPVLGRESERVEMYLFEKV
ncbi:hypothetical protein QQS21_004426 [Conoideocrella luteorostrata]|uniref:Uncharacterized protein n=1 Tax=Conoideocrella luteorostrata TaxID=1105319 RepID=A0AAJ0CTT9_9HYPO|nr:hypothetical protein QQS21_004426 [Conoideocrella luteorostrata]